MRETTATLIFMNLHSCLSAIDNPHAFILKVKSPQPLLCFVSLPTGCPGHCCVSPRHHSVVSLFWTQTGDRSPSSALCWACRSCGAERRLPSAVKDGGVGVCPQDEKVNEEAAEYWYIIYCHTFPHSHLFSTDLFKRLKQATAIHTDLSNLKTVFPLT